MKTSIHRVCTLTLIPLLSWFAFAAQKSRFHWMKLSSILAALALSVAAFGQATICQSPATGPQQYSLSGTGVPQHIPGALNEVLGDIPQSYVALPGMPAKPLAFCGPSWQPNYPYVVGNLIEPIPGGTVFQAVGYVACASGCTSGSTQPPQFAQFIGTTYEPSPVIGWVTTCTDSGTTATCATVDAVGESVGINQLEPYEGADVGGTMNITDYSASGYNGVWVVTASTNSKPYTFSFTAPAGLIPGDCIDIGGAPNCTTYQQGSQIIDHQILWQDVGPQNESSVQVQPTTTNLAVTSDGTPVTSVAAGSVVTLTATVKAGGAAVTVGQVNFCDASATSCTDIHLLGTAQLTSAGTTVLKFVPGIGSHHYKAVFAGTPNGASDYAASASSPVALSVTGLFPTSTAISASGSVGDYSLTATVTGLVNASTLAAPAGTVSFLDTTSNNFVLGTAPLGTGTAGLSFLKSSNPATNPFPQSVAVADFNGDGKLDLAVPVYSIFTPLTDMNILLGNGDVTFTAGPAFPLTGQNVNNAAVADFNGDGIVDMAISLPDANEVQVLLGNGDGSFTPMPAIPATGVFVVATGDFNRDGKADLVLVNPGPGTLTILLGNGDGTFTAGATIPVAGGPQAIAVGDFNGDGNADLAVVDFSADAVTVLLGNGDGTFTEVPSSPTTGNQPAAIAVADFNGDGILDLAVSNLNGGNPDPGSVTVLLGNGDGTFTPTAASPVTGSVPNSIAVGDFNGDGKADLVTGNAGSNTASVLLGNGDGTFAAPLSPAAGTNPLFVAVGDFNGDGLPDLAAANNTTKSVTVLLAQETQTATATATGISPVGTGQHLVEASYAGDATYLGSISPTLSLTASLLTPAVTVTPSASSITTTQPLNVTIAVSGVSGDPTTTGTVTLTSGNYNSGATTLTNGSATINIPAGSLAVGTDTLTASYSGDSNYTTATGTSSVTVTLPAFTLSGTAVTVAPGATTGNTSTITVKPAGGFTGSVTLTAALTSSPAGAQDLPTFSFGSTSPVVITGTAAGTATLTISTTAPTMGALAYPARPGMRWYAAGVTSLAFILLVGIPARGRSKRKRLGALVFLMILAGGLLACGSSGGSGPSNPGTTPGTYTITVTGTSGSTTATAPVTLTVQ